MELCLKPGPQLIASRWHYDHDKEEGCDIESDVTDHAAEFLFTDIALDKDVTVRDIFFLLSRNPVLLQVFRRDWAAEMVADALQKRPVEAGDASVDVSDVEYLEIYNAVNL